MQLSAALRAKAPDPIDFFAAPRAVPPFHGSLRASDAEKLAAASWLVAMTINSWRLRGFAILSNNPVVLNSGLLINHSGGAPAPPNPRRSWESGGAGAPPGSANVPERVMRNPK